MLSQCISAFCVLGVVVVALLVMVQAINLEQAASAAGRVFLLPILVLAMLCLVKSLIVAVVVPGLAMLQRVLLRLVGIAFVAVLGVLAIRWLIFKLNKWLPERGNRERGEP